MAGMKDIRIAHEGKIIGIFDNYIRVEIVNKSACAACHAKSVCAASDESIKYVDVPITIGTMNRTYEEGEKVVVMLKSSLAPRAVLLAYGVPLVILLVAMVIASSFHLSELFVGLTGIAAVALYYVVLAFFRNRLSRVFTFSIEKTY